MNEEQRKQFEALARPMMQWLNENCHTHTHVIIDNTSAELSEGVLAFKTTEYVKD